MSYDTIKNQNRRPARAWLNLPQNFSPSALSAPATTAQIPTSRAATQATGKSISVKAKGTK